MKKTEITYKDKSKPRKFITFAVGLYAVVDFFQSTSTKARKKEKFIIVFPI